MDVSAFSVWVCVGGGVKLIGIIDEKPDLWGKLVKVRYPAIMAEGMAPDDKGENQLAVSLRPFSMAFMPEEIYLPVESTIFSPVELHKRINKDLKTQYEQYYTGVRELLSNLSLPGRGIQGAK